ncbi:MAG: hypothetical protein HY719_11530 [Planctomycetes bacterium]|nr:hypothetical protein [Planctomycetota bacterium]
MMIVEQSSVKVYIAEIRFKLATYEQMSIFLSGASQGTVESVGVSSLQQMVLSRERNAISAWWQIHFHPVGQPAADPHIIVIFGLMVNLNSPVAPGQETPLVWDAFREAVFATAKVHSKKLKQVLDALDVSAKGLSAKWIRGVARDLAVRLREQWQMNRGSSVAETTSAAPSGALSHAPACQAREDANP